MVSEDSHDSPSSVLHRAVRPTIPSIPEPSKQKTFSAGPGLGFSDKSPSHPRPPFPPPALRPSICASLGPWLLSQQQQTSSRTPYPKTMATSATISSERYWKRCSRRGTLRVSTVSVPRGSSTVCSLVFIYTTALLGQLAAAIYISVFLPCPILVRRRPQKPTGYRCKTRGP